jgi:lipopolysaccharide/colanic/teichoic acid biosynthesis glycosyltransferase
MALVEDTPHPRALSTKAPSIVATLSNTSGKRLFDILAAIVGLPAMVIVAVLLIVLNPFLNPGPLFFRQCRMGRDGERFTMLKFRTMRCQVRGTAARKANDPVEEHRITRFGQFLRTFRIDELPNSWNVLWGQMSLIGPRPDAWDHAEQYWNTVPFYKKRFNVRPGITGLAQVRGGYADNPRAIQRKARFDHHYVKNRTTGMELHIIWRTIIVVLSGFGSK